MELGRYERARMAIRPRVTVPRHCSAFTSLYSSTKPQFGSRLFAFSDSEPLQSDTSVYLPTLAAGPLVLKTRCAGDCLWSTQCIASLAVQAISVSSLPKLRSTLPILINPRFLCFLNLSCAWIVASLGSSLRELICSNCRNTTLTVLHPYDDSSMGCLKLTARRPHERCTLHCTPMGGSCVSA